jgi:hypothetical protein
MLPKHHVRGSTPLTRSIFNQPRRIKMYRKDPFGQFQVDVFIHEEKLPAGVCDPQGIERFIEDEKWSLIELSRLDSHSTTSSIALARALKDEFGIGKDAYVRYRHVNYRGDVVSTSIVEIDVPEKPHVKVRLYASHRSFYYGIKTGGVLRSFRNLSLFRRNLKAA